MRRNEREEAGEDSCGLTSLQEPPEMVVPRLAVAAGSGYGGVCDWSSFRQNQSHNLEAFFLLDTFPPLNLFEIA